MLDALAIALCLKLCRYDVFNTLDRHHLIPTRDVATLKFGVFAVSSTFLPSWMLMEYWCINCKWCLLFFPLALLSDENLHSLPEVGWKVFSPESTPLVIRQSPLTRKFIDLCRGSCLCLCLSVYLFISLLLIFFFQIDRLEPSLTYSVFRFHDSISSFISSLGGEAKEKKKHAWS